MPEMPVPARTAAQNANSAAQYFGKMLTEKSGSASIQFTRKKPYTLRRKKMAKAPKKRESFRKRFFRVNARTAKYATKIPM
jgi:hypothetical protein